jgi:hypothetical protein
VYEVVRYPTVYFGDLESPELHLGELDYDSLAAFVDQNLRNLPCSVENLDACDEKVKKTNNKLQQKAYLNWRPWKEKYWRK